jgi:hypothetical protein
VSTGKWSERPKDRTLQGASGGVAYLLALDSAGDSGGGCGNGEEFVAFDPCGYAYISVYSGFHADDLAATADVDFACLGDQFWESEDEFDLGAYFELSFGEEIESLIANVAGLRSEFMAARFARKDP